MNQSSGLTLLRNLVKIRFRSQSTFVGLPKGGSPNRPLDSSPVETRAPAGRCNGVHLHPLDFGFQIFHRTIGSLTQTPPYSFLQSENEIRQQVLVFH